ncbi:hypothetical protein C8J56DRAFT_1040292 [Mycena floridula]|nr:hypothetical protein C8J56DRAFT_1040292 [Mycena floridula]
MHFSNFYAFTALVAIVAAAPAHQASSLDARDNHLYARADLDTRALFRKQQKLIIKVTGTQSVAVKHFSEKKCQENWTGLMKKYTNCDATLRTDAGGCLTYHTGNGQGPIMGFKLFDP